jgi:hypothetical protein
VFTQQLSVVGAPELQGAVEYLTPD